VPDELDMPTNATRHEHRDDAPTSSETLRTVERAVRVLELVGDRDRFTLKEAASELELSSTIAYRILQTWVGLGYLHFDDASKHYSVGQRLLWLRPRATAFAATAELKERLRVLSARVGQTSNVGILVGRDMTYLARNVVRKVLMYQVDVGTSLPAHATSMGRVLLAALGDDEVRHLYPEIRLEAFTEHTVETIEELIAELAGVREHGYAISKWQLQMGVCSVAMPLRDRSGAVVAAINVAGTSLELSDDVIRDVAIPALRDASLRPLATDVTPTGG
jgi:IclR family pca regulon transcriptional regulator